MIRFRGLGTEGIGAFLLSGAKISSRLPLPGPGRLSTMLLVEALDVAGRTAQRCAAHSLDIDANELGISMAGRFVWAARALLLIEGISRTANTSLPGMLWLA